jgi:hypothetical protein
LYKSCHSFYFLFDCCVTFFLSLFIYSLLLLFCCRAQDFATNSNQKTLSAAHIIQAVEAIGFGPEFGPKLSEALESITVRQCNFYSLFSFRFEKTSINCKGNKGIKFYTHRSGTSIIFIFLQMFFLTSYRSLPLNYWILTVSMRRRRMTIILNCLMIFNFSK